MAEGCHKEEDELDRSVLMRSHYDDLSYRIQMGSNECGMYEYYCQPCDVDDNHVEATFYCNNCREYMCPTCSMYHKKFKLLNDHDVLDMNNMIRKPPVSKMRPGSARPFTKATYVKDIVAENTKKMRGSAFMSNSQLLLVSYGPYTVGKVMLVDASSGRLVSEMELKGTPDQVTRISDTDAAITLPKAKTIVLIRIQTQTGVLKSTKQKLSVVREIDVHGECRGIAYTDNTFVVTFAGGRVDILDMSGKVIRNILTDNHATYPNIFTKSSYVTVSPATGSIYVSDLREVVKLSKEGNVLATYSCEGNDKPYQVLTDNQGMVYVVSANSCCFAYCGYPVRGCVKQLSANLNKAKTIIPDISPDSQALSYDEATRHLFVGELDGTCKVYKLS